MVDSNSELLKEISAKLNVLITLQLRGESQSVKEGIKMLSDLGLGNRDTARILGTSLANVAKERSMSKGNAKGTFAIRGTRAYP